MLMDPKYREIFDKLEKDYEEKRKKYEPLNPFLCGVERSRNVRIYDPKSKIPPYTEV